MSFAFAAFIVIFVAVLLFQRWALRPRPEDFVEVTAYAEARGLRVISITPENAHWKYWLRGRVTLSNAARTYVLLGQSPVGVRTEVHLALDPWNQSAGLQVLLERNVKE